MHADDGDRHKIMGPPVFSLPDLLQSTEYKDPTGVMPTALSKAHHTGKHAYAWLGENPWALKLTLAYMKVQFESRPSFFDVLDFQARFGTDSTSSAVLFVDIGGSTGSQSLKFRQRYPSLPGRVIIQDRPEVIQKAKLALDKTANIELEVYDIFTPEPIKGMNAESSILGIKVDSAYSLLRGAHLLHAQDLALVRG